MSIQIQGNLAWHIVLATITFCFFLFFSFYFWQLEKTGIPRTSHIVFGGKGASKKEYRDSY